MKRKHLKMTFISMMILGLLMGLLGCMKNSNLPNTSPEVTQDNEDSNKETPDTLKDNEKDSLTEEKEDTQAQNKEKQIVEEIDYEVVRPNELGEVMILMYHQFGETERDIWWRSFENFKKDLQILYDRGYRAVSMQDFLTNNINIPAGTTPVIFTFDDGTNSQFNLIEKEGELVVNPKTAVGIMKSFYEKHPDFGLEATFYINDVAFAGSKGTEKERLQYLLDSGMDIGNHTFGHTNLAQADIATIQSVIGKHYKKMYEYFPDYRHYTLALPYGAYANSTFEYTIRGEYEGLRYEHDAVLLVGWKPSPAPAHKDFYPTRLVRVRAGEGELQDMYYYLDYFEKNAEKRYVSDGNPNTIAFPEKHKHLLDEESVGDKKVITY